MVLPVLAKESSVIEVVSVLLSDLYLAETCGLLETGSVKDGIIEGGKVFG